MKIFISYAHKDRPIVDQLAEFLRKGGHDIWYDDRLVAAKSWKAQLLAQIKASDCFLYALTPESVASEWCQWEFSQAVHAGKPIVTVLLQETTLTGVLEDHQYVDFRDRTLEAAIRLGTAVYEAELIPPEKVELLPAPDSEPERPIASDDGGQTIAQRFFDDAYEAFRKKDYDDAHDLVLLCLELEPDHQPAQALLRRLENRLASTKRKPRSIDLLPAPFTWIEIPGGRGTLKTNEAKVTLSVPSERYWIAKYPVTNAQFARFIEAGGYDNDRWWTAEGWEYRRNEGWTQPRYWEDRMWNGAEQPVVGISWFEAVAFCRWLSDVTGETIMLPTEAQWQYAAQGHGRRAYPWGNKWDCKRCNNSVSPCNSEMTTPVTRYEGRNDSYFGVVDMAGNVWEWCLTDYDYPTNNNVNSRAENRVLRGGSWYIDDPDRFRCDYRYRITPNFWDNGRGFRLARS